jgi:tripartite-type tricarboxylate transporter receptor subunit TctC
MPVNTTSRIPDRSSRPDWVKVILHPSSLILGCALASAAGAQPWPAKPLRIVAPSAAGSAADTLARVVAPPLSERLGQPVVVDTRPGAATIIGTEIVAKSPADGHTLLIGLPALTINPAIYKSLSYDGLRDFTAITQGIRQPNLLVVHPSLPVRSTKELIALAKARPGELVYASAGIGAASHLTMELFMLQSGTKMLHVPYKGPTPGVIDLIAGRVSVMATSTTSTLTHVRSGRLRALGITTATRAPLLPDIPTVAETGLPGYEAVSWFGFMAPTGTPKEVIARLHKEIVAILNQPEVRERFARDGAEVVAGSPEEFNAYVRSEALKWAKVVKAAGIKPEG